MLEGEIFIMNQYSSVKKNFMMNIILTMSSFIFPLITFPYVSRILLPVGTGKVSFAVSLISYFNMFAQLGIPTYGICECAKVRDNRMELSRTAHELLLINASMSIISYVFFALAVLFIPKLREEYLLYIIVSFTIFFNAIGMEWLYKALEQYSYITIRSVLFKFIALVFMFMLIHEPGDYIIYGGITILAASASNVMNLLNIHKYIDMRFIGNYHLKRHIKPIIIFFAMACATTIYTNLDTIMLGFMTTDANVGYYNAAIRIKTVLVSIVTSLGTVLLPRVSYYIKSGMVKEFYRIVNKSLNFTFLIASPLMVYFILFARQGIFFLSGVAYEGAIIPMRIIMPTLLLIGITNVLGIQILVPLGKEKIVLYSEVAGAVTDCILNFMLIPKMFAAGAAIGTLIAEFVVLVVQSFSLREEKNIFFREINYAKIILALFFSGLAAIWVIRFNLGEFLTLLISACLFFSVYGGALLVMRESFVWEIFAQIMEKTCRRKK